MLTIAVFILVSGAKLCAQMFSQLAIDDRAKMTFKRVFVTISLWRKGKAKLMNRSTLINAIVVKETPKP
jgi:hypothetical protein